MTCMNQCSGHGRCVSLREAGAKADGRVLVSDNTYSGMWDSDMLHGCVCDAGYTGFDCSER